MPTATQPVFPRPALFTPAQMPDTNFKHISNLTDQTGIIQHAIFSIPNRKEGYCIDDNARALLWAVLAGRNDPGNQTVQHYLPIYLSFIHYMQTEEGHFRNFLSYTRESTEDRGSEDSFGRTMMALGFLIKDGPSFLLIKTAEDIFAKAYSHVPALSSPRGIANTIIGLCQFIECHYPDDEKTNMVISLSNKLVTLYEYTNVSEWRWFEKILTYDNAILPLALLYAYEVTHRQEYLDIALESMQFLESKVFFNGMLRPIGNDGWHKKGSDSAVFDQQGIDVMAMVLLYEKAYSLTHNHSFLAGLYKSYQWFLGDNDLRLSLYDISTGGCADGLHSDGINLNQGAESTLAYWISHAVVASTLSI